MRVIRTIALLLLWPVCMYCGSAHAGRGGSGKGASGRKPGTIVHLDGTMTVMKASRRHVNRAYVYKLDKNGRQKGGCIREEQSAYQLRRAYMRAKSRWRPGYIPRNLKCQW